MSFFSPITERSPVVRFIFTSIYGLLVLGALTMIVPLLVTITGSMSGTYDARTLSFFPRFLAGEEALWGRYLEERFGGNINSYKMAFDDPNVDFYQPTYPIKEASPEAMKLWKEFRAESGPLKPDDAGLAFTKSAKTMGPALENRLYRKWALAQFGDSLDKANQALSTQFARATSIVPPVQNAVLAVEMKSPLSENFDQYLSTVPESRRLFWDVGNFYRTVYLPRIFETVGKYNEAQGTQYASFSEIPFPSTMPETGGNTWFGFVQRILSPTFVQFTPEGEAAFQSANQQDGINRIDFIRLQSKPEHLRVDSIDIRFTEWAAARGVTEARIPSLTLAWQDFVENKGFWRKQFATQNYVEVIDEVMIQGNGLKNTLILIVLSVGGALTVNPLAAYALSRYKLPQSYHILLFFLATIAFPPEVSMIPNFLQLKELGLLNTFGALVLPSLVNGFSIFLLKGFFDSLPRELYEAADIDGASEWQIFWGITMNLSKPILAVIALGAFTSAYGAFFFALILAPDPEMWTLMVWIYQLRQEASQGVVYASVLLTAVPTLIIYLCAQNVILRGIVVPTEK